MRVDRQLHWIWQAAKQRYHNPNSKGFPFCGGRGLTMHAPWRDSFDRFYADIMAELGPRPTSARHSLIRVDVGGEYEPGNLAWATYREKYHGTRCALPETWAKAGEGNRGKTLSEKTRAQLSRARTGQRHSPETKRKLSAALKGKPAHNKGQPAHNRGVPMSDEQKVKLSATWTPARRAKMRALKGTKRSGESLANIRAGVAARDARIRDAKQAAAQRTANLVATSSRAALSRLISEGGTY